MKEGKEMFLFNDALVTFYLRLYGVRHMVKAVFVFCIVCNPRGRKEMFYLTTH